MAQQIQLRRDTAANWTSVNPILAEGEIGVEENEPTSQNKFKIGNGIKTWTELEYFTQGEKGDQGPQGPTGPKGDPGDDGEDGNTIISGTVDPVPSDGVDGDYFINYTTNFIFGPKAAGQWPAGVSIVGPKGDKGDPGDVQNPPDDSILYGRVFDEWEDVSIRHYTKNQIDASQAAQDDRLDDLEDGTALDGRYVNKAGDTMTGDLVMDEAALRIRRGALLLDTDANPAISFRNENEITDALLYYWRTGRLLEFVYYDADGSNSRPVGRLPDRIAFGGVFDTSYHIATLEHGDTRWQQLQSDLITASDDLDALGVPNQQSRLFRLSGIPANAFPNAGSGDWLMHFQYSGTAALQVAYNYNRSGGQVWSSIRKLQSGTWSEWEPAGFGLADIKLGFINDAANYNDLEILTTTTHKAYYVNVTGAANEPPNVDSGDIIVYYKVFSTTRAVQIHYPTNSGVSPQFRVRGSGGGWSAWERLGEIAAKDRIRWRTPYSQANTYEENDAVLDQGAGTYWTMVANKQTTERAAPQADDNPVYSQPEVPTWATLAHTGVVESGMEWETLDDPIILIGYQVWVPTLSANTNYVIRLFTYTEDDASDILFREISEPLLTENAWTTIAINRDLVLPGTKFGIRINALNSGADTIVGPFDWGRSANSNGGAPVAGDWNRRNQNNIVRIHEVDDGGVNRGPTGDGSLEGIIAGSTIQIVSQNDATESATYTTTGAATYGGGVYEFPVTLDDTGAGGEPPVGQVCAITITVPIPSPTDYVEADPSEDVLGGVGFLELDGVPQAGADAKSYGIRILADTVTKSPDWDVMSWVGSGGGGGSGDSGGGGGASVTTGPTLPTGAAAGDLHYLTVDPVGLFVYYDDGTSAQWVQSNGGGGGGVREFHDPAGVASWRISGNTLECWGTVGPAVNTAPFLQWTFPKTFKVRPTLTVSPAMQSRPDPANVTSVHLSNVDDGGAAGLPAWTTTTGYAAPLIKQNSGATIDLGYVNYHAIGEWDGVS